MGTKAFFDSQPQLNGTQKGMFSCRAHDGGGLSTIHATLGKLSAWHQHPFLVVITLRSAEQGEMWYQLPFCGVWRWLPLREGLGHGAIFNFTEKSVGSPGER